MKTVLAAVTLTVALAAVTAAAPVAADWEASAAAAVAAQSAVVRARLAAAPAHRPEALPALLDLVEREARGGKRPVVIFDLDDTLVDTAYRQMAILRGFALRPDTAARFPDAARRMAAVTHADVRYELGDTLKALGVADVPAVLPELTAYWAARFFDNGYLLLDRANAGGVDFVRETVRRGGTAVYLTGRWEDMRPGTEGSLAAMGYPPADGSRVLLMMKPDRAQSDIDFKKTAFERIAALGEVVGGFENEPANVNAYRDRFVDGIYVFLDTRHSTTAVVPEPEVYWVGDFRY